MSRPTRSILAAGLAALVFAAGTGVARTPDETLADALLGGEDGGPMSYDECVAEAGTDPETDPRAHSRAKFLCAALVGGGDEPGEDITGPTHYIETSDGTLIAAAIRFPAGYDPANPAATRFPTILEMSGYESGSADHRTPLGDLADMTGLPDPVPSVAGGTRAIHGVFYDSTPAGGAKPTRYVSVTANIRGTGCSTGEFDLFSRRSAEDGVEVVDWIAAQPWSNGKIGLFGHSYSGMTAAMIAALAADRPDPKIDVVSISGLIGDLYRDIVYPGGVTNFGFPLLWTLGVRPLFDVGGGSLAGILADRWDRQCLRNQSRRSRTVLNDPVVQGVADEDNAWYQARSLVSVDRIVSKIPFPTHVTAAYQDEQSGPYGGANVYDALTVLPRRLLLLNGDHPQQRLAPDVVAERIAWLDHFLLDPADRRVALADLGIDLAATPESSRVLLEVFDDPATPAEERTPNGKIDSNGYPLAQTVWTDVFFTTGGALVKMDAAEGTATWLHGSKRQSYSYQAGVEQGAFFSAPDGPDELVFTIPTGDLVTNPGDAFVIAGPVTATLWVSTTAVDTELMVQLIDVGPDGDRTYLQRGLLRASHRAILPARSDFFTDAADVERMYRPWRPHTNAAQNLLEPGAPYELLVEIPAVAHVFHPGHVLMVKIHAPSLDDNDYIYLPKTPPAVNTLHHGPTHLSRLTLPAIPAGSPGLVVGPPTPACADSRMRCVPGS